MLAALALLAATLGTTPATATPHQRGPVEPGPLSELTDEEATYRICPHLTDSIARLYAAYFDRGPDDAGFEFWADQLSSGQTDLDAISTFFSESPEFRIVYGADKSATEFVELVYQNVLGRGADAEGLQFWTNKLEAGELSRGAVMLNFSESPEFVALTNTSDPLAGHFSWYPEGTRFVCGQGAFTISDLGPDAQDVDVLSFVDPRMLTSAPQAVQIVVRSESAGSTSSTDQTELVLAAETVPLDLLLLRNLSLPTSESAVRTHLDVRADAAAFTYIAVLPADVAPFAQRSGWEPEDRLPTMREFVAETELAVAAVDAYWDANAPDLTRMPYVPPTIVGTYDGFDALSTPRCGTATLRPNNAYYCSTSNWIAWDLTLMANGYAFGDSFIYFVIAHEWAHSIQAQIDAPLVDVAEELQADCLAGAALYGWTAPGSESPLAPVFGPAADRADDQATSAVAVQRLRSDNESRLIFEPGDVDELRETLRFLADDEPWTNPQSHGNPEQRIDSFAAGATGGIDACLAPQQ